MRSLPWDHRVTVERGPRGGGRVNHVVMFSGGLSSWATARRVAERQGTADLVLLVRGHQSARIPTPTVFGTRAPPTWAAGWS